jgi:hypothetical protein
VLDRRKVNAMTRDREVSTRLMAQIAWGDEVDAERAARQARWERRKAKRERF